MKTRDWQRLLGEQVEVGKTLFTLTELANASGAPRRVVTVEMARLVRYGVVVRHAKGLYGLAGTSVPLETLLRGLDPHAYVTGAYALMRHGVVTQVPAVIHAFTARRHSRTEVQTPEGRIEFVSVAPPIHRRGVKFIAGPEMALCDYVYIMRRRGMNPATLVTLRHLRTLKKPLLMRTLKRYPATVRQQVAAMVEGKNT